MNRVLENLEPSRVFYYFEEISKIPRGSRNTSAISNYCKNFAEHLGLECKQDQVGNIIIKKTASFGREKDPGVMLQAHLDMVNEKKPDKEHDFNKDGIPLKIDGDYICADGTTLGADDGIGVAYLLAILEDKEISHPPLEIVFTVDEEIGLLGAAALDMTDITSKYLINLDSEEDDILWAGCAGGMTSICNIPIKKEKMYGVKAIINIGGLKGGHSGAEIDKGRANANILLGRVLYHLKEICPYSIQDINGGFKKNAIPRESKATLIFNTIEESKIEELKSSIVKINNIFSKEYEVTDSDVFVNIDLFETGSYETYNIVDTNKIIFFLTMVPNDIQNMSSVIKELVETSLNLGIVRIENDVFEAVFSVRSSIESRKMSLGYKLKNITEYLGGNYKIEGNYPGWDYKINSHLRNVMIEIYEKMFGITPQVKTIHAGLECGYFNLKCPWLDIVSFGPNVFDVHTTEERMSISSVEKVYKYLLEILKEIK